jgi:hypothetical protein
MAESNKSPHPKKAAFLAAYASVATISHAAKLVGIDRSTHYDWLEKDPQYVKDFNEAKQTACDNLEAEARRRAVAGCEEVVYYQGVECGRVRKYSDTLLIVLLKAAMPEKYIERRALEHSGSMGLKIDGTKPEDLSDADLARIAGRGGIGVAPPPKGSNGTPGVH